jgi:hypothetical protein
MYTCRMLENWKPRPRLDYLLVLMTRAKAIEFIGHRRDEYLLNEMSVSCHHQ